MTMTTLTVYDPPMCCSTGICGPDIDPKLAQFAGDLDWLKSQGVDVRRFNLAQEPASFVANADVKAILDRSGGDELPAILVGGVLVANGRYPGRDELRSLAGLKAASAGNSLGLADTMLAGDEPIAVSKPCCGGSAKAETSEPEAKGCC
jgi:hypothetical protein